MQADEGGIRKWERGILSSSAIKNASGRLMRDYVLFYVNGRRHEVRGERAFRPLSEFLREELGLPGTKVVCAEGDCGSCTVLLGRSRAITGGWRLEYQPVTSCIQYVAQLDGAHVVTVEGLAYDGELNPVQRAMVEHHGAQCGFCTPGIVTTMCGLFDEHPNHPSRGAVQRRLVGNLCRCTGYASILDAADHVDTAGLRSLQKLYSSREMVGELRQAEEESAVVTDGTRTLYKPATLAEAVAMRAAHPEATVLAGGTDLGVVWNKRKVHPVDLLCIGSVPELNTGRWDDGCFSIGAATTLATLASYRNQWPSFAAMLDRFGSPPIRNAGTLGGNLVNGSPIGDTIPGLMVLNAEVELAGPQGSRRVNLNDFYVGYRKTAMRPDELLVAVHTPLTWYNDDEVLACYKISKRRDLDISSFTAAVWMKADGDAIGAVRIAYGGVAATVVRLPQTEAALVGQPLGEATWRNAGRIARSEIKPISDVRGSAEYRSTLAANILVKFGREYGRPKAAVTNGHAE